MQIKFKLIFFIIAINLLQFTSGTVNFVKQLIQNNVVGAPVLHKEQNWEFDPDVGVRRSRSSKLGAGVDVPVHIECALWY